MVDIILIEPETEGNIGAIARVMKNFGFNKLILIDPKANHMSESAMNRAKHAKELLKKAKIQNTQFYKQYDYLIATTAKTGTDYNITRSPITPKVLAEKISNITPKKKIGLVIGREGYGLFNEEIEKCDFVVTIPSHLKYPTLNISHAVGIILYELFQRKKQNNAKTEDQVSHITPIGIKEKQQIEKIFSELFNSFKWETPERRITQEKLWKRIIGKSFLSKRESFAIMGLLRKILQKIGKAK